MTPLPRHGSPRRRAAALNMLLLLLLALSPAGVASAQSQGSSPICHPRIRLSFQLELDDYRRRLAAVRSTTASSAAGDNPLEMVLRWLDGQVMNYKTERKRKELEEITMRDYSCRPLLR